MKNEYGICRIAVAPIRVEGSDRVEISSQLLFGDHVQILEKRDAWWLIQSGYDGYQGWVDFRHLTALTESQYNEMHDCTIVSPQNYATTLTAADGSLYYLSAASNLPFYQDGFCYAGAEKFKVNFNVHHIDQANFNADIVSTAKFFQNTPYLWGGRNQFGFDCSGFVQTVYKLLGIKLLRDAYQQAEQGKLVDFLAETKAGDVAFFDNAEGKITHVGIMLNNHEIIHSSGKVRIDPIDNEGIFNKELNKYTHKLRIIKRFVD